MVRKTGAGAVGGPGGWAKDSELDPVLTPPFPDQGGGPAATWREVLGETLCPLTARGGPFWLCSWVGTGFSRVLPSPTNNYSGKLWTRG